jgi:hypothetical protein
MCGAWVCSFAWGFLCFKMPLTWEMGKTMLTFYNLVGNGPDFLLGFSIMLSTMYLLRPWLNERLVFRKIDGKMIKNIAEERVRRRREQIRKTEGLELNSVVGRGMRAAAIASRHANINKNNNDTTNNTNSNSDDLPRLLDACADSKDSEYVNVLDSSPEKTANTPDADNRGRTSRGFMSGFFPSLYRNPKILDNKSTKEESPSRNTNNADQTTACEDWRGGNGKDVNGDANANGAESGGDSSGGDSGGGEQGVGGMRSASFDNDFDEDVDNDCELLIPKKGISGGNSGSNSKASSSSGNFNDVREHPLLTMDTLFGPPTEEPLIDQAIDQNHNENHDQRHLIQKESSHCSENMKTKSPESSSTESNSTFLWTSIAVIIAPLLLTIQPQESCIGYPNKFKNIFVPCAIRETWSSNLPALPHLFYFNLGLVCSRFLQRMNNVQKEWNAGVKEALEKGDQIQSSGGKQNSNTINMGGGNFKQNTGGQIQGSNGNGNAIQDSAVEDAEGLYLDGGVEIWEAFGGRREW